MLAYEALEGKFDYNKTPLVPLGTKSLIYQTPSQRAAWEPHAINGYWLGPAMKHYQCGCYFIPPTRAIQIASITKHYPTHYQIPTILQSNQTLLTAADLLKVSEASFLLSTKEILQHANMLQELTAILQDGPPQRVLTSPAPRVGSPSTSNDTTAPHNVCSAPRVH